MTGTPAASATPAASGTPTASGAPTTPAPSGEEMPAPIDAERLARAAFTYLAEPGDPALGALLAICEPAELLAAIRAGTLPTISRVSREVLERSLARWRVRLPKLPASGETRPPAATASG